MGSKRIVVAVTVIAVFIAGLVAAAITKNDSNDKQTASSTQQTLPSPQTSGEAVSYPGKGLIKFPKEILSRTDITSLDLSNNNLTGALPAEIRRLSRLEELNVSNNNMTGIPAEIGQLKNLKVLNYSNNKITGLPLELGNLTQLQILNLSGNNVSQYDLGLIRPKLPNTQIKL